MKLEDVKKKKGKEAVRKAYRDFIAAREHQYRQEYAEAVKEADNAFLGDIFNDSQKTELKEDNIPVCKTNRGAINSIRYASILTASRPTITATPIGGGDAGLSTLLKRDYSKVWDANTGEGVAFDVTLDSVKEGLGWVEVYSQRYNGIQNRTIIEKTPPSMVYLDPTTTKGNLEDTGFRIKAKTITEAEAKTYGLKKEEMYYVPRPEDLGGDESGSNTVDSRQGGSYDDVEGKKGEPDESLGEWKRQIWQLGYYQMIRERTVMWMKFVDGQVETQAGYTQPTGEGWERIEGVQEDLLYVFIIGKKLCYWTLNPLGKDHQGRPIEQLIPLPNIPVKKAYPRGNLFLAIPALQEVSKRRGQSIAVVAHTSGSPHFYKDGTLDKAQAEKDITKPKKFIPINASSTEEWPKPAYQSTPDISRVFELETRAMQDADYAWQLNPALKGEAETSKMSGKLHLLLKEAGLEGSSYFMVGLHGFFRKIAIAVTALELQNQPSEYWDRLLEEEDFTEAPAPPPIPGQPPQPPQKVPSPQIAAALEKLKARQVDIMNWDIKVQPGSSLPSDRYAKLDFYMELSRHPVHPESPMDIESILEMVDHPDRQRILARKSKVNQMGQQLAQLEQVLKEANDTVNKDEREIEKLKDKIAQIQLDHEVEIAALKAEKEIAVAKVKEIAEFTSNETRQ